jgi:hypothetical protein
MKTRFNSFSTRRLGAIAISAAALAFSAAAFGAFDSDRDAALDYREPAVRYEPVAPEGFSVAQDRDGVNTLSATKGFAEMEVWDIRSRAAR